MEEYNDIYVNSFLGALNQEDREALINSLQQKAYKKGEQIVRAMDDDTNVYFIQSGSVRVTLYSSDGKEVNFVDLNPGGNFGEISAIDGKPRSANVIALTNTVITVIPSREFLNILKSYPDACLKILSQLTSVVRRLCDRIFEYSTLVVRDRVIAELLRLSRPVVGDQGVARIDNPPTQTEMASMVSCTREAVSRELNKLESNGIIKRVSKCIVVKDYLKLKALVKRVKKTQRSNISDYA